MFDRFFRIWVYMVCGSSFLNFVHQGATGHWGLSALSFLLFVGGMTVAMKLDE